MANLDDIWGANPKSNLNDIWGSSAKNNTLDTIWGTPNIEPQQEEDKGIVQTVLDAFDKPASAIAGAAQYIAGASDDNDIVDAAQRGWNTNAGWKPVVEKFAPEFAQEHPIISDVGPKIIFDPLWVATPAKVARLAGAGAKALGVAGDIERAANVVKDSELVQRIVDTKVPGTNLTLGRAVSATGPLDEELDRRAMGIIGDTDEARSAMDNIRGFKDAAANTLINKGMAKDEALETAGKLATEYTESSPDIGKFAPKLTEPVTESERLGIIQAAKDGTLNKAIIDGQVTKEQALHVLADAGEKIPGELLSESQRGTLAQEKLALRQTERELKKAQQADIPGGDLFGERADLTELANNVQQRKNVISEIVKNTGKTRSQVLEDARQLGLSEQQVQRLYETGEQAASLADKYTKELYKQGQIDDKTMVKFLGGTHLRREYARNINPDEFLKIVKENGTAQEVQSAIKMIDQMKRAKEYKGLQGIKLNLDNLAKRLKLSEETQRNLGRVYDAEYLVGRTSQTSSELIHTFNFLEDVATNHAVFSPVEGYRKFVGTEYGPLAGKWAPENIYHEVQRSVQQFSNVPGMWRKAVSWWKAGKTILNPATHFRNFFSNMMLMNIGGMPAHEIPIYMAKAAAEMRNKGNVYREATKASPFLSDTFTKAEMSHILQRGQSSDIVSQVLNGVKGITEKAGDIYQTNEKVGKLAAYIWAKDKGRVPQEAAKFANDLLFDYAKVPPIVDWLRRSGVVPFASFPYFATIATGKALWNAPAKVTKYYKPVSAMQDKDEQKLLPDYTKPQTMLPIDGVLKSVGIDRTTRTINGKSQKIHNYLDLQSIYPFTNEVSLSPAFDIITALKANKDSLGRDIARKGMTPQEQIQAQAEYLYKLASPSMAPGNYSWDKLVNQGILGKSDYKGRTYDLPEAAAHTIFGLRNVPINLDETVAQQLKSIQNEQKATLGEIKRVLSDNRLSPEEKKQLQAEHVNKIQQLGKEAKELNTAYKQWKKKEGR